MKITITKLDERKYSFIEEGKEEVILDKDEDFSFEKKTGKWYIRLPENSLNRKVISTSKFNENPEIVLDKYKETISISSSSKKSLEDYMTEEEKKTIQEIRERAELRRDEEKKRLEEAKKNPIEKAKKQVNSIIESLKKLGMSEEKILELISKK
jgi:DNA anti-recombination protein RmuC